MLKQKRKLKQSKLKERDSGGDTLTRGGADGFIAFLIVMAQFVKAQGFTGNVDKVAATEQQKAEAAEMELKGLEQQLSALQGKLAQTPPFEKIS